MIRFNPFFGVRCLVPNVVATGGAVTEYTDEGVIYKVHTFNTSGTFNVFKTGSNVNYLIVAGGGGGGGGASFGTPRAAGGGAGGLLQGSLNLDALAYPIIVGAGGGGNVATGNGTNGSDSSAFTQTAIGGGGGGGGFAGVGNDGGSGGGSNVGTTTKSSGTAGQGFAGGGPTSTITTMGGGGGGGAGAIGGNPPGGTFDGGIGGAGLQLSINGTPTFFAVGGNGGVNPASPITPTGGAIAGQNATTVGSGGGGMHSNASVGNGSDGVVVIRYPKYINTCLPVFIQATGGDTFEYEEDGNFYRLHTFNSTDTFEITQLASTAEYNELSVLVVAGGGSGGSGIGGVVWGPGGGGGEVVVNTLNAILGTYTMVVGAGGVAPPANQASLDGGTGTSSTAFGISSNGGLGGTGAGGDGRGGNSGSGKLGGDRNGLASGGGAGDIFDGGNAPSNERGGPGGDGRDVSNIFTTSVGDDGFFGGGGAGLNGGVFDGIPIPGGKGGGATNIVIPNQYGVPGDPNTGGGGAERSPGNGGSGIVIVKYQIQQLTT